MVSSFMQCLELWRIICLQHEVCWECVLVLFQLLDHCSADIFNLSSSSPPITPCHLAVRITFVIVPFPNRAEDWRCRQIYFINSFAMSQSFILQRFVMSIWSQWSQFDTILRSFNQCCLVRACVTHIDFWNAISF
jgi:hypothetical protein